MLNTPFRLVETETNFWDILDASGCSIANDIKYDDGCMGKFEIVIALNSHDKLVKQRDVLLFMLKTCLMNYSQLEIASLKSFEKIIEDTIADIETEIEN